MQYFFVIWVVKYIHLVGQRTTEEGARSTDLVKHHIRLDAALALVMSTTKEVLLRRSERNILNERQSISSMRLRT